MNFSSHKSPTTLNIEQTNRESNDSHKINHCLAQTTANTKHIRKHMAGIWEYVFICLESFSFPVIHWKSFI